MTDEERGWELLLQFLRQLEARFGPPAMPEGGEDSGWRWGLSLEVLKWCEQDEGFSLIEEAVLQLQRCRNKFQAGDREAMLEAIHICCGADIPVPPWVAEAYSRSYLKFRHFHVRSLDEAFGSPRRKGTHLAQKKEHEAMLGSVFFSVKNRKSGVPIDGALFEEIGAKLGISGSKCSALYYEAKRMFEPDSQPGDDEFLQTMRTFAKAPRPQEW